MSLPYNIHVEPYLCYIKPTEECRTHYESKIPPIHITDIEAAVDMGDTRMATGEAANALSA